MDILWGVIVAGLPLLSIELLTRRITLTPEVSRKLVHVTSCAATLALPLWLTLQQISLIAGGFCIFLAVTHVFQPWQSLQRVSRRSWGEVAFAAGVLLASLIGHNIRTFIAAVSIMGLADTAAALIGSRFGKHRLRFNAKSAEGSLAFFVIAATSLFATGQSLSVVAVGAALTTAVEYLTPYGLDNATVPLVVTLLLNCV